MRSTTSIPSNSRPNFKVCAVRSQIARRLSRRAADSALRTGHSSKKVLNAVGQVKQVIRQDVGLELDGSQLEDLRQAQNAHAQPAFGRVVEHDLRRPLAEISSIDLTLTKDALDPSVGVLQISRRVAIHGKHLLPVKYVVAKPVLGQVGILDGAHADDLCHSRTGFLVQVGAVRIDDLSRFRDRLFEQRFQAHHVAFPGLEWPSVGAQDRAKGDVLQIDPVVTPPPRRPRRAA